MPYYDVIRDKTAIETKWVYKTISKNNQPKPDVKINKYGQELSVGSLLVGTPYGSSKGIIIFGRVSRWTAASVFINPMELGDGASKKISNKLKGDVRLYNYSETYVLPEEGEDLSESFVLTKLSNM